MPGIGLTWADALLVLTDGGVGVRGTLAPGVGIDADGLQRGGPGQEAAVPKLPSASPC